MRALILTLALLPLAACTHHPGTFAPARGQSATQLDADTRDCDREVHSAGSQLVTGMFTGWSEKERDGFIACMTARGYVREPR